jgi:esterase/lipase superfamily enzyme
MGADATSRAIAELGERGKMFDQIILAAPDIDRDVFRTQLAPRLAAAANRTTMYCSQQDFALIASKTFNDAPRAGDSSRGVLVAPGMDTIDASTIDTDLLGHSYYGDCMPLIEDLRQMIENRKPPGERKLKAWPVAENLNYWSFTEERSPSTSDESSTAPARSTLPP